MRDFFVLFTLSQFSELLEKDDSVSIHMRNIPLAIERFHVSRNISPPIMNDIFKTKGQQLV